MLLVYSLVLDANILIRAILGNKVRQFLLKFSSLIDFFTPDICIEETKKYLPIILLKRGITPEPALETLFNIQNLIQVVGKNIYQGYSEEAKKRMRNRDLNDWPILATAMTMNCPIWTEDQDFFGSGIPTWTTDRIHILFENLTNKIQQKDSQTTSEII